MNRPAHYQRVEREWWVILDRAMKTLGELPPIDLQWSDAVGSKPRHFADAGNGLVRVHPKLEQQDITVIRGVLAHEVGHICDPYLEVNEFDSERRADKIAEMVTGWRIYYGVDTVQRAGPGARGVSPRPRGLK